jgi:hypothetical protein
MSGSDVATVVIAVVFTIAEGFLVVRMGHYFRTGRWFR